MPARSVDNRERRLRTGIGPMRSPGTGAIGVVPVLTTVRRAAREAPCLPRKSLCCDARQRRVTLVGNNNIFEIKRQVTMSLST